MKKLVALFTVISLMGSTAVFASPPKKAQKPAKPAKKIVDVMTCPIMGSHAGKEGPKPVMFEGKRVHFCCGGCPESFNKLTVKEKRAKVAAAMKKDAETHNKKSG